MSQQYSAVIFKGPYHVDVEKFNLGQPQPDEIVVETKVTAVSSGTEMLAYRGEMPKDIPTDETIGEFSEPFSYPCRYGYCAVGVVRQGGSSVDPSWLGKRVFAFQPHVGAFITHVDNVFEVPDDISDHDAVMLPHAETAVSLVMDAAPAFASSVVIAGQGLIGLLTAALIRHAYPMSRVTTLDLCKRRREESTTFAQVSASFDPQDEDCLQKLKSFVSVASDKPGADIAIDVSSSSRGLDTCIECVGTGGKVVVGSWFGAKTVNLRSLGGSFHRSHMTVVASQVSSIPPHLLGRWSKKRRFDVTWDVLRRLNPQRLGGVRVLQVEEAAEGYALLSSQPEKVIQMIFTYQREAL